MIHEHSLEINSPAKRLALESLSEKIPVIPGDAVGFYKHNCMVCFYKNGHSSGVNLSVDYNGSFTTFEIYWTGDSH